jgi:hypothetical protein
MLPVGGHDVLVDGCEEERLAEGARPKAYSIQVGREAWHFSK